MDLSTSPSEGIIFIDKPTGWTSFDVVAKIRSLTGVKKVGHAGTLDPLATGLLIILVGKKYTRMQDQFLKQDKTYVTTARLGMTTDSYDSDGVVTSQLKWAEIAHLEKIDLENCLDHFRGKISQTVPAFSAVKVKGRKLYDLARRDQLDQSSLPSREVEIKKLKLLDFNKDEKKELVEFEIEVNCSSGTYIRSLVHDIGQCLGVGATVAKLRRTSIGDINLDQAQTMDKIVNQFNSK